jgi:hypothetical protein
MCVFMYVHAVQFTIRFFFQNPFTDGEANIKQSYDELHEELVTAFRNLED